MEVVYRILLTSIAIPWKGYIIGHDKGLFSFWFSNKMVKLCISKTLARVILGMHVYDSVRNTSLCWNVDLSEVHVLT